MAEEIRRMDTELGLPPLGAHVKEKEELDLTVEKAFPYPGSGGVGVTYVTAEDMAGSDEEIARAVKGRKEDGCPVCLRPWGRHRWADYFIVEAHQEKGRDWFRGKTKKLGALEALITSLDGSDSPGRLPERDRVRLFVEVYKDLGVRTANDMQLVTNYSTAGPRLLWMLYNARRTFTSVQNMYDSAVREFTLDSAKYVEAGLSDFSDHEGWAEARFRQIRADAEQAESWFDGLKETVDVLSKETVDQRLARWAMEKRRKQEEEEAKAQPPSDRGHEAKR